MPSLSMAYSPCPNDTFMFCDVAAGKLAGSGHDVSIHLHDVETLNRLALTGTYDLTKVSFHTYLLIRDQYQLLDAGAALGFGCGPLVVARQAMPVPPPSDTTIALPGELTTAHLLLRMWAPNLSRKVFVPYDRVMEHVLSGQTDAGVIIHESRFVYRKAGLVCLADLGEWWETTTGHPIPLGCIVARKSLGTQVITRIEDLLRQAILRSRANPDRTRDYVGRHAREISPDVQRQHIDMFVNDFSVSLGEKGRAAVAELERRARLAGVIP
jgi:1,4-dihydroxy-6-naphthoate synthase